MIIPSVYVALGKVAQRMECLFYMLDNLRLDSQYPHRSQYGSICVSWFGRAETGESLECSMISNLS